jgi:hypothetical protein
MSWSPARCSTWLKNYADEVARDAFNMGGDDVLYACAGIAYYAVSKGIGYNTKEEFSELITEHMGLDQNFLYEVLLEIEK